MATIAKEELDASPKDDAPFDESFDTAADQLDFDISDNEVQQEEVEQEEETRGKAGDAEEGEIDELEEGEVKDEEEEAERKESGSATPSPPVALLAPGPPSSDVRPEDMGICKFFLRGQCTWGNTCKFLHPGTPERGAYRLFPESLPPPMPLPLGGRMPFPRPLAGLMESAPFPPPVSRTRIQPQPLGIRPRFPPPGFPPLFGPPIDESPSQESAWEKGLKAAKELVNRAKEKKESDSNSESNKRVSTALSEESSLRKASIDISDSEEPLSSRSPPPLRSYDLPMRMLPEHRRESYGRPRSREGDDRGPRPLMELDNRRDLPPPPDKRNHNYPPPKIFRGTSAGPRSRAGGQGQMESHRPPRPLSPRYAPPVPLLHLDEPYRERSRGDVRDKHCRYSSDYPRNGSSHRRSSPEASRSSRKDTRDKGRPLPYDRPSYSSEERSGWRDPWERRRGRDRRSPSSSGSSPSSRSGTSPSSSHSSSRSRSRSVPSQSRSVLNGSSSLSEKWQKPRLSAGAEKPQKVDKSEKAPKELTPRQKSPEVVVVKKTEPVSKKPSAPPEDEQEREPIKLTISSNRMKFKGGLAEGVRPISESPSPPRIEMPAEPVKPRKSREKEKEAEKEKDAEKDEKDKLQREKEKSREKERREKDRAREDRGPNAPPPKKQKLMESSLKSKDSRREELLRQLKAVEDAIAKKRDPVSK